MATFWMSAVGTDTASGTNFASAKKTLHASITAATGTKGNTLNIVNDGTHSLTTAQNNYTGPTGTSWADWGLKIRGCDTNGVSSLAEFAGTGAQANWFAYLRAGARWWIIEGLKFDMSAGGSTSAFIKYRDTTAMPLKLQYCWFSQANAGSFTNVSWPIFDRDTTDPSGKIAEVYKCYFQNIKFFADLMISSRTFLVNESVFVFDTDSVSLTAPTVAISLGADLEINKGMTGCTVLYTSDFTGVATPNVQAIMCTYPVGAGDAAMTVKDNLVAIHKTTPTGGKAVLNGICNGPAAPSTAVVTTADIDYNYFAIGSNVVTSGSWTSGGIYSDPWDTLASGTGTDDVMTNDTLTNLTPAEVFSDPDSSYDWKVTSKYTLEIPDLRARVGTWTSEAGGQVGALDTLVQPLEPDVDPPGETTSATFLDVRPFFEPTMQICIIARHKQKVNRILQSDLRAEIEPELYSEAVHRQLDLATNTTKTINMGGVETGEFLAVQTNNTIKVAAGDASFLWPVSKMLVLAGGSFQTLTLVNESTVNAATVLLAVVD